MSKEIQDSPKNEEVDIIQIFSLIGKAIKSVTDFIVKIFELLFKGFILITLFVRNNLKKLVLAAFAGFVIGTVSDFFEKSFYTSFMIVEPNFETNSQLIESVRLYSQLARSKDSTSLAEIFKISESEAADIISINFKPRTNGNIRLKSFDQFIKDSDTLTIKNLTFKDYQNNLELTDYKQFFINVDSDNKYIYKKIEQQIVNIPIASYIEKLQQAELKKLEEKEQNIKLALVEIDSLRENYKKIMLSDTESQTRPSTTGNNFYLSSDSKRPTNELELFKLERDYNNQLEDILIERAKKEDIVNIVAGFQNTGIKVKDTNRIWFTIGAIALMIFVILLIEFNKYLSYFEKKIKSNA